MPYPGVVAGRVPLSRPQIANVHGKNVRSSSKLPEDGRVEEMSHFSAQAALQERAILWSFER